MARLTVRLSVVISTLAASAVIIALAAVVFLYSGIYDVAATVQHGPVTNWALHTVAVRSIDRRAQGIKRPDLSDANRLARGARLFRENCVQCHGAPGVAPAAFAMGLTPAPPPLIQVAREWSAAQIYWTTANGIKMTAMPPWQYRFDDDDLWSIVAFVETLPKLSVKDYATAVSQPAPPADPVPLTDDVRPGDPTRGQVALSQYACASCHVIPGVVAPPGRVGPVLSDVGERTVLAGVLANTPANMKAWIRAPQRVKPGTAMPDMGVTEQDARDMAAYLESLR